MPLSCSMSQTLACLHHARKPSTANMPQTSPPKADHPISTQQIQRTASIPTNKGQNRIIH